MFYPSRQIIHIIRPLWTTVEYEWTNVSDATLICYPLSRRWGATAEAKTLSTWKTLTPEQKENRRIYRREWTRRRQQMCPELYREEANKAARKWHEANREKSRAYAKKWLTKTLEERPEYDREKSRRYYQENKERVDAHKREYRARNPDKVREWERRREARDRLRREPSVKIRSVSVSATEANHQLMQQNKAFAAASQYVPRNLPQDMRDDIISDIVVACLEVKIRVEDVKKNVPRFIRAHNKAAGYNISLDAEIGDGMRLIDIITEENLPW